MEGALDFEKGWAENTALDRALDFSVSICQFLSSELLADTSNPPLTLEGIASAQTLDHVFNSMCWLGTTQTRNAFMRVIERARVVKYWDSFPRNILEKYLFGKGEFEEQEENSWENQGLIEEDPIWSGSGILGPDSYDSPSLSNSIDEEQIRLSVSGGAVGGLTDPDELAPTLCRSGFQPALSPSVFNSLSSSFSFTTEDSPSLSFFCRKLRDARRRDLCSLFPQFFDLFPAANLLNPLFLYLNSHVLKPTPKDSDITVYLLVIIQV